MNYLFANLLVAWFKTFQQTTKQTTFAVSGTLMFNPWRIQLLDVALFENEPKIGTFGLLV